MTEDNMTVGQLRTRMTAALAEIGKDTPEALAELEKTINEIDLGYTGKQFVDALEADIRSDA